MDAQIPTKVPLVSGILDSLGVGSVHAGATSGVVKIHALQVQPIPWSLCCIG